MSNKTRSARTYPLSHLTIGRGVYFTTPPWDYRDDEPKEPPRVRVTHIRRVGMWKAEIKIPLSSGKSLIVAKIGVSVSDALSAIPRALADAYLDSDLAALLPPLYKFGGFVWREIRDPAGDSLLCVDPGPAARAARRASARLSRVAMERRDKPGDEALRLEHEFAQADLKARQAKCLHKRVQRTGGSHTVDGGHPEQVRGLRPVLVELAMFGRRTPSDKEPVLDLLERYPELCSVASAMFHTGSRAICDPPTELSDDDWAALRRLYTPSTYETLATNGWILDGACPKTGESWRKDDVHLILFDSQETFEAWRTATALAKAMNLASYEQRKTLFGFLVGDRPLNLDSVPLVDVPRWL